MPPRSGLRRSNAIELGSKMAALRDNIPTNNRDFGRAVRKFDLGDRAAASAMMRVARRYAGRPDIFEKAANWRVLVQLSSTLLPESSRQAFGAQNRVQRDRQGE